MTLKSCGVLIVRRRPQLQFLLMQHPRRWDLPKGHVDPGESELQCARRELEEETGFTADDIRLDDDFRFTLNYEVRGKRTHYKRAEKTLVIFLGELLTDREVQPTEHEGWRWFDWNPPHRIQEQTIDPLLAAVEKHFSV